MTHSRETPHAAKPVRVTDGGRVVIPSAFRRALGMEVGSRVFVDLVNGEIRIRTLSESLRHSRELLRRYIPDGTILSDELIQDRRREGARE